jgi:hypothetical protein
VKYEDYVQLELQLRDTEFKLANARHALQVIRSESSTERDKDAARYDFLRRFDRFALVHVLLDDERFNTLDAAVDHAMSLAQPEEKHG